MFADMRIQWMHLRITTSFTSIQFNSIIFISFCDYFFAFFHSFLKHKMILCLFVVDALYHSKPESFKWQSVTLGAPWGECNIFWIIELKKIHKKNSVVISFKVRLEIEFIIFGMPTKKKKKSVIRRIHLCRHCEKKNVINFSNKKPSLLVCLNESREFINLKG